MNSKQHVEKISNNPVKELLSKAHSWDLDIHHKDFALKVDSDYELTCFRKHFHIPKMKDLPKVDKRYIDDEKDSLYFNGNSMGLQPKTAKEQILNELTTWSKWGSHGYLSGTMPWAYSDETVDEDVAVIVGAKRSEVAIMNALTINLHLQLISFYKPSPKRHKILVESRAFPSDHYAIESQIRLHGYDPKESMICMEPREGEDCLREKDILALLESEGDSIALVLFPGVQYYTGQLFDIELITKAGQAKGCYVGWDLAHAVGNVELQLHDWGVDIACWCSYKYLNSGPGAVAGFFIHEKHFKECKNYPRLIGWWSHNVDTRYAMDNALDLDDGARGFRISHPFPLLCASLRASLGIFGQTSMKEIRKKSKLMTAYLELLLKHSNPEVKNANAKEFRRAVHFLTPSDPERRGAQLSISFNVPYLELFSELQKRGVVCDKRDPGIIRVAPAPLYNTFEDLFEFVQILGESIDSINQI